MIRGDMLAGVVRELRGHYQGRNTRRKRRRRQASGIFPAIEGGQWSFPDDELRRRPNHDRVGIVVEAARDAEPPGNQYGQRDLVQLGRLTVRSAYQVTVLMTTTICTM